MLHGKRIALLAKGESYSYQSLLEASEIVAAALMAGQSDLKEAGVAFLVSPGADYVASQWGIWRAGGIAVPLSLSATEQELEYTLADSQVTTVIVDEEFRQRLADLCLALRIRLLVLGELTANGDYALPEVEATRRAMILYTSGTTSRPKGVVTTHDCIRAQIESLVMAWHWQSDDRIPLFLPLIIFMGLSISCAVRSGPGRPWRPCHGLIWIPSSGGSLIGPIQFSWQYQPFMSK